MEPELSGEVNEMTVKTFGIWLEEKMRIERTEH
jgi:hypothetical protein